MTEPVSPQQALTMIKGVNDNVTLIVDLDHTLHLGNSTEDFLDFARPSTVAATILAAAEKIRPWRRSADPDASRFHWRLATIAVLMPWTILRWNRHAKDDRRWNTDLLDAVRAHSGPVVVASNGYRIAVAPLVSAVLPDARVVARSLRDRNPKSSDKFDRLEQEIGHDEVIRSAAITDSLDDSKLLENCATAVLTEWPGAQFRSALTDAYVPLRYSAAKHDSGFLWWGVAIDDLIPISLTVAIPSRSPALTMLALLSITFAVRCIYDLGYHENDHLRPAAEPSPHVTETAAGLAGTVDSAAVAIWTLPAVFFAALVLGPTDRVSGPEASAAALAFSAVVAMGVLAWLRTSFALFNRRSIHARRWLYPLIQTARYGIYPAMFVTTGVARVALVALIIYRWLPYLIYRRGPERSWPERSWAPVRLLILAAALPFVWPVDPSGRLAAVSLLGWWTIRSAPQGAANWLLSARSGWRPR